MGRAIVLLLSGMMLGMTTGAGTAGAGGEAWDGGHMRSRYRSLLETPLRPSEVRGVDRYGAISNVPIRAPLVVPETLTSSTQRSWQSGPTGKGVRRSSRFTGSFIGSAGRSAGPRGSSLGSRSRSGVRRQSGR